MEEEELWRVWIRLWSLPVLSAGVTAWPVSRIKRSNTAVPRPDIREWKQFIAQSWKLLELMDRVKRLSSVHFSEITSGQSCPDICPLPLCLLPVTLRWTKDKWLLLVRLTERNKWVPVRPLPHAKNFPPYYDVGVPRLLLVHCNAARFVIHAL